MYYYIVNPSAGGGTFETLADKLKSQLRRLDIDGEFSKTLSEGDAAKITAAALKRGADTIVAVGGDHTVNEVVTAVHGSQRSSTPVGIIPIGYHNTLAGYLGISEWQQACELLAARRLRPFHPMHVNNYSFLHTCRIAPASPDELAAALLGQIDGSYRLRGQVGSCTIANQNLRQAALPSELIIELQAAAPTRPGWWQRLRNSARSGPPGWPTRLHARTALLEFENLQTAVADGREFSGKRFSLRLSDLPVQLIAARTDQQGFDS